MNGQESIPTLLTRHWAPPYQPVRTEFLGSAGGFSGARLWRLESQAGRWCLRRWPHEHPTPSRLNLIHSVLRHAASKGFAQLPQPAPTLSGETFARWRGHLWELTPWLAGRADFHERPSEARLRAALTSLARFHRAVEDYEPGAERPSPGLAERSDWSARLLMGELDQLRVALRQKTIRELGDLPNRVLAKSVQRLDAIDRELSATRQVAIPIQPAIRDIWHDHVLFDEDRVTGIVDFGSLRFESVAGDVARLVGSLVGDVRDQWTVAIAAYESIRPLSPVERELVGSFDRSGVVLSGLSWLQWLYLEDRHFDDLAAVRRRLEQIVARLES